MQKLVRGRPIIAQTGGACARIEKDHDGRSSAAEGHADIVKLLLSTGVDVNRRYANDLTALMWAAGFGRDAVVIVLIDAGADPELKDNRGKTAADIAGEQKFATTVSALSAKRR